MAKQSMETQIAVIGERTKNIETQVLSVAETIKKDYVTRDEFKPVKNIVYGLIALILVAVVGALLALVINR